MVAHKQQILSQSGIDGIVHFVHNGLDVIHAKSDAADQHILPFPRYGTASRGGRSNLQPIRPRPQNPIHGANTAPELPQRHQPLH